jgi:hypothetical protein
MINLTALIARPFRPRAPVSFGAGRRNDSVRIYVDGKDISPDYIRVRPRGWQKETGGVALSPGEDPHRSSPLAAILCALVCAHSERGQRRVLSNER